MHVGTPQARRIVLALLAGLLVAFALHRWTASDDLPEPSPALATSSPSATASSTRRGSATTRPSPVVSSGATRGAHAPGTAPEPATPALHADASPQARPTPPVFDFATLAHAPRSEQRNEAEPRFTTNEWFTQEDRRHPERYFELAERMPELNRPEERRDTLAYFVAYREKLRRDLEAAGGDGEKRRETRATIARYDAAISRLRKLIEAERAK